MGRCGRDSSASGATIEHAETLPEQRDAVKFIFLGTKIKTRGQAGAAAKPLIWMDFIPAERNELPPKGLPRPGPSFPPALIMAVSAVYKGVSAATVERDGTMSLLVTYL